MTIATVPSVFYEFAFNADPNQGVIPPYWTDLSGRVQYGWTLTRGRQYELDINEAGVWKVELANTDGALDPGNAASPFAPNVLPYRPCRIRMVLGNNLLTPDQASAGEWSPLAPGPAPAPAGVTSFGSSLPTIASVGGLAYQGTQVWTTTVANGTPGADLLDISVLQVTAGTTYTFSAQAQALTSGQNPACYVAVNWLGTTGQTLSTTSGSPSTLTGAGGTWTQLVVTGQAPAGAVAALLRVVTTTTPSANSTVWTDGLQLEARSYATRWQMPWTPGVNLLPQNIATGLETMNVLTDAAANWFTPLNGTVARTVQLSAAPGGATTAVGYTFAAGRTPASTALYAGVNPTNSTAQPVVDCTQVVAGQSYTASVYLGRTASTDVTVQFAVNVVWFNSAGSQVTTTFGTGVTVPTSGWVRASLTGTAPAGAAWGRMYLGMTTPATTTAQNTLYATGWQMEQAGSATTWADPGPSTFLFTGLVERFPRTWSDLDSTYGTSKLQCVDATAALSQLPLPAPFVNEVLALGPSFFYQLADAAGSSSCADTASKRVPVPVENGPFGAGTATFGSSVTSTNAGLAFVGTSGPVLTLANNASEASPFQFAETFLSLHKTAVTPGPPPAGPWTRIICFRAPATPAGGSGYQLWYATPASWQANPSLFSIHIESDGKLYVQFTDSTGSAGVTYTSSSPVCDGNWHMVVVGAFSSGGANTVWLDGTQVATAAGVNSGNQFAVDTIGALVLPGSNRYSNGYNGDLALIAEVPAFLTSAQVSTLYNSWRTASTGESSGARYARILKWIGWTGPTSIATGQTASMGPATDTSNLTPVAALNAVAATENGDSYVSAGGVLTFTARSALYGVRTPQVIFGEGLPVGNAGEWPVEVGSLDFDPAHLANTVQVTQYQGSIYTGQDATSVRRYYGRLYQRTINTTSGPEAQDVANYLVSQLKDPHQRANIIRAHPSAMLGLFPVVAQIDKGTRIRLMKRPIGAPATQIDAFIQRIEWTWSPLSDVFVQYQASPADLVNYWRLGALHTTLSAQAAAGQANATINALPDAATNKLAQSLPTSQVLWFEPGTSRFEAVTVLTIPSTVLGYSTATLVMTGNFSFTHPAGSIVCEPLPTGYTDPTTWDASSVLGAAYAPILSGGASGTNTVTVGPMQDSVRNAVGQNWNTGDVVWLSSGVPARQEAATIQSVATTYPGYTSCTITFTANLANNHPAGDFVSDVMPSNTINPSTWTAPTTRATY